MADFTTYRAFANWCQVHSEVDEEKKFQILDREGREVAYIYGSVYKAAAGVFWSNFMSDLDRQRIMASAINRLKRLNPRQQRRAVKLELLFQEILMSTFSTMYGNTLQRHVTPIDINVDIKKYQFIVDFLYT